MVVEWLSRAVHILKRGRHQGQVLILTALGMTVLLGFVAVSVDVGYALTERRQVQTAVDSAAIAAADAALANASDAVVISTAKMYGADNAGVSSDDVDVQRPPTSGDHAGDRNYIEVSINKEVPRFFTGAVYHGDWSVSATAMSAIVPAGFDAAILALNGSSGGIATGGSTTIRVTNGGSIVSNYNYSTTGNTQLYVDGWVAANQGIIKRSGSLLINAGLGQNGSAPQIPDPLKTQIEPPTLPDFPSNPIANVNPTAQNCFERPGYSPTGTASYLASPGTYCTSGGSEVSITGNNKYSDTFEFQGGNYKFNNKLLHIHLNGSGFETAQLDSGTYIFTGSSSGIKVDASTDNFIMKKGQYAFLNGASFTIGGNAPHNVICEGATTYNDCTMYFSGGGGITTGGSNNVTLYPGTYIFDGGPGLNTSGNAKVTFEPGTYKFYFGSGADLAFSNSATISIVGSPYVQAWFFGKDSAATTDLCPNSGSNGVNSSDLCLQGDTNFSIPSGEYYFDNGRVIANGSSQISGTDVFMYFKDKSYLYSSGRAGFAFTAPTTEIYPGYYPGVFMYADRANTSTFTWTGATTEDSTGIVYLPSSQLVMNHGSNGKVLYGQIIADSFNLSGNNQTTVQYQQFVKTSFPKAFLVQ